MAGIGAPPNLKLDGRSIVPLLKDEGGARAPEWDDTLFGQYDMHHYKRARMRMIRTPQWKLVRHYTEPGEPDELYDLTADPEETNNLIASPSHGDRLRALKQALQERMESVADPLLRAPAAP